MASKRNLIESAINSNCAQHHEKASKRISSQQEMAYRGIKRQQRGKWHRAVAARETRKSAGMAKSMKEGGAAAEHGEE